MGEPRGLVSTVFVVVWFMWTVIIIISLLQASTSQPDQGGQSKRHQPPGGKKHVLVTGAAGFIGFHVAYNLAKNGHHVVGLDNFNDYYDVQLKIDRAFMLNGSGVVVHNQDLCNQSFLEELFSMGHFTHVIHLAAQAGVRFSMKKPLEYVRTNIQCHLVLLNVIRSYPGVKVVYASSSSVYGKGTPVPFRTSSVTSPPGNMYAATKSADELLGVYYCLHYNMSLVGLRFFTVYGPWGRPDMAVYKFCEAIDNNQQVPLFSTRDGSVLARDFTYIDDIVSGILGSLDYIPRECGECFNLGHGRPVSIKRLIRLLQKELSKKANIKHLPLPSTELLQTWADTSDSLHYLNFSPSISLSKGVKYFVDWYQDYATQRNTIRNISTQSMEWFRKL